MTAESPPPAPTQILFVCSGNTCRSPMAEGFCKRILTDDSKYRVSSAGTSATPGEHATQEAINALCNRGIDISRHRSRLLTEDLIHESSFIFAMTERHRQKVLEFCREADRKCFLLAEDSDIADPFEQDQDVYNECAAQILKAVQARVSQIISGAELQNQHRIPE